MTQGTLTAVENGKRDAQAAEVVRLKPATVDMWRTVEAPLTSVGLTSAAILRFQHGESCLFWFLRADTLRSFSGVTLPKLQDIRRDHPEWLVQREISFVQGCKGEYVGKMLVVSHCWEEQEQPDREGEQFAAIKTHLLANTAIELVWIDYNSMPQGQNKLDWEKAEFAVMLPNINLLYLFCSVLILVDRQYMGRFWTQFEAFLSLRKVTAEGLAFTPEQERRCTVSCIRNAPKAFGVGLIEEWESKSAEEAYEILKQKDVKVTNATDKEVQLLKLRTLADFAKRIYAERVA